ncbi:MAG: nuclear transport factor 2 family protein [Actinomycetota bacterium]|nr:nuclear transport factor 2 family protein [Actinomycetota bacterium]
MGTARDVVERYYDAFDRKDPAWKELVASDVRFEGPLQQASGSEEFSAITEMFLGFHKTTRVVARFEDGDRVCSILEFDLATPAGGEMSCVVTELATVEDGRLSDVKVIYDPREFARAFGLS